MADDEFSGDENFEWTVWRYVARDAKAGLKSIWRWILELLATAGPTLYFLFRHGSPDAPMDWSIERLYAIPIGMTALMVIHFMWSWATAPRRIFYRQQRAIKQFRDESSATQRTAQFRQAAGEIIAAGWVIENRTVTTDPQLTEWERDYQSWGQTAVDWMRANFGDHEAQIFLHTPYTAGLIRGSHGLGHNDMRLRMRALLEKLQSQREKN